MPEMTGLEATKRIRRHEFKNKLLPTPIIALTAAGLHIREECMAAGMNGFITKPYCAAELQNAITQNVIITQRDAAYSDYRYS